MTHVVLVDRPASQQALAAALSALPKACLERRGFPGPAVIDKDWFVQSAKRKRALPLEAFTFEAGPSEDETRGAAERAASDARGDFVRGHREGRLPAAPYGTSEACLASELRVARGSLERWRKEERFGENDRKLTREALGDFAAEGFPGLVGRTHAARRILEAETFPGEREPAEIREPVAREACAFQSEARNARRGVEAEPGASFAKTPASLLDLPDELLAACFARLPLLDTLAVAATCRRLANAALGPPLPLSEARVEKNGTTNWGRRRDAEARFGERAGWSERSLAFTPGVSTAREVWNQLDLGPLEGISIAVNQELVGANQPLQAGDELAFLPPFTGG